MQLDYRAEGLNALPRDVTEEEKHLYLKKDDPINAGAPTYTLNAEEEKFVYYFLDDYNFENAAEQCGLSSYAAWQYGFEMMGRENVQLAICDRVYAINDSRGLNVGSKWSNSLKSKTAEDAGITPLYIMLRLKRLSDSSATTVPDKIKALHLMGKQLGMFQDRSKVDVSTTFNAFSDDAREQMLRGLQKKE
jgi:hypothetical protein